MFKKAIRGIVLTHEAKGQSWSIHHIEELCPEKTKGRGSQRGEMVPDEPGGSLSSILWLWDQPQGSQGLSQQK